MKSQMKKHHFEKKESFRHKCAVEILASWVGGVTEQKFYLDGKIEFVPDVAVYENGVLTSIYEVVNSNPLSSHKYGIIQYWCYLNCKDLTVYEVSAEYILDQLEKPDQIRRNSGSINKYNIMNPLTVITEPDLSPIRPESYLTAFVICMFILGILFILAYWLVKKGLKQSRIRKDDFEIKYLNAQEYSHFCLCNMNEKGFNDVLAELKKDPKAGKSYNREKIQVLEQNFKNNYRQRMNQGHGKFSKLEVYNGINVN